MSHYHVVGEQETVRSLSNTYGVATDEIWNHPNNAELRQSRQPNVLHRGDRVFIPNPSNGVIAPAAGGTPLRTGQTYTFGGPQTQEVALRFRDCDRTPRAGWHYRYQTANGEVTGTLDSEGQLVAVVPVSLLSLEVFLWRPAGDGHFIEHYLFDIGALAPVSEALGAYQRMWNLRFRTPDTDVGHAEQIHRYQCSSDLLENGQLDEYTRTALTREYGS